MVFTLSFNIAVSRIIIQHWQWQSVGYGPVKEVKFCFRTSSLTRLSKLYSSASALPLCIDGWRSEIPLPHFCSALTAKDLMIRFRNSALPWLPKIWSSASAFRSALTGKDPLSALRSASTSKDLKLRFRTCSARTSKDVKFGFRISSLPGLPKVCSFASALSLNLDCQRADSTNTLPPPLTRCLHCQIWEVPHPNRSDFIPKDVNVLLLCLDCQKFCLPQFSCMFILCISTLRAVLGLALRRDEASLFASKNQTIWLLLLLVKLKRFLHVSECDLASTWKNCWTVYTATLTFRASG